MATELSRQKPCETERCRRGAGEVPERCRRGAREVPERCQRRMRCRSEIERDARYSAARRSCVHSRGESVYPKESLNSALRD